MFSVSANNKVFTGSDGNPLDSGYLYFGAINTNPETNPISVYWDKAGTIPALQPIRTINGYPARNGAPAIVYVSADFSCTMRDKNGVLQFTAPTSTDYGFITGLLGGAGGSALIGYTFDAEATTITVYNALRNLGPTVKDFGAAGDGVTDDTLAIQTAINWLSNNGGGTLHIPEGVYLHSTLYFCYDAEINPDFNTETFSQGRITLHGVGCGDHTNARDGNYIGSVLKYADTTGDGLVFNPVNATTCRNVAIRDLAIVGETSDRLVNLSQTNTACTIERVVIFNDGEGVALFMQVVYNFSVRSCFILGTGKGKGIWLKPTTIADGVLKNRGGGDQIFQDVTCNNFDVAWDLGNKFSTGITKFYKNLTLIGCQGKASRVGMSVRYGITGLALINCWFEGNGGSEGRDILFSSAAGFDDITNDFKGALTIIGGNIASNPVSDPNGICLSQTLASAGALTINGAFADAGVATLDFAYQVSITSASNNGANYFSVTGTDKDDNAQSETLSGPIANTVKTTKYYKTITSVSCSPDRIYGTCEVGFDASLFKNMQIGSYTADVEGVCATQSPGGAGNLNINGTKASGGYADLDGLYQITVTASTNETANTFTFHGNDWNGDVQIEAISGPSAGGSVTGTSYFSGIYAVECTQAASDVQVGIYSAGNDAVGAVSMLNTVFNFVAQSAIRKYNDANNGVLTLDSCAFHNNGGNILEIEDAVQNGDIIVRGNMETDISPSKWAVGTTSGDDVSGYVNWDIPAFLKYMSTDAQTSQGTFRLNITPHSSGNLIYVTGAADLKWIQIPLVYSCEITLIFSEAKTVKNNNGSNPTGYASILLAGAADFVTTANDVLTLVYCSDAGAWLEKCRSIN